MYLVFVQAFVGWGWRKQTLRMVESARPLMTPRADLANGVAGVVVVGALLSMESGTVPIGGGVGSQLAKVVAVGGRQLQGAIGLDEADEAGLAQCP